MTVLLAKKFDPARHDVAGWMASEKLDGMRAYWNGESLQTRNGNPINAPSWFTIDLPDEELDGELWIGRGKFQRTVSVCRKDTPEGSEWEDVMFKVFDAPKIAGVFKERYEEMLSMYLPSHAEVVEHTIVTGAAEVAILLAGFEAVGGEGVMLRDPESAYERKRSNTLLKVKSFQDADALIVGYQDGEGRNEGRLGALRCKLDDGTEFRIGTGLNDSQREDPPLIGDRVTFSFFGLTDGGVPRFPAFIGVRAD